MRILRATLIGLVFGAVTSLINNIPGMLGEVGQAHTEDSAMTWAAIFVSVILDSGWAWASLAFVLGLPSARRPLTGALAGAAGLLAATLTYYLTDQLLGIESEAATVTFWLIRAVVFGLPLGAAGTFARSPGRAGLLAGLIVPLGAAANLVLFPAWTDVPGESPARLWADDAVWIAAATVAVLVVRRFVRNRATSAGAPEIA